MARKRGTQKGYLHKQGNMWYIAFREDALDEAGRIIRVRRNVRIGSAKELSKREARRIADEDTLGAVNAQAQCPSSMLTVSQFIETRFRPNVIKYKKHAGQLHYDYILSKHVLPALGERRLRDVTSDDVQTLINLKHDAGLSPQTVLHIKNVISAVFSYAKAKKAFRGEPPTEGVEMPEMVRKEKHALTFEQATALLEGLRTVSLTVYAMVLLAITTSMNIAEVLGLKWKRLNLDGEAQLLDGRILEPWTVAVRENLYRGKLGSVKAKSRVRDLPLTAQVVSVLKAVQARSIFTGPDDLVFTTEKGTALDQYNLLRRVIKPIAKKAGTPWIGWHVFRHTHSTLAEQIGMPLSDRQAQMGHGDVRMTLHYTHSDLNRRRTALEQMATRLVGAGGVLTLNDTKEDRALAAND